MTPSRGRLIATGRTAEVYAWDGDRVLKLLRPGFPDALGEAEAVAARLTTLAGLQVPAFHGTVEVDGRLGLLYERLEGPSMLDVLAARPWTVRRDATDFARLHASVHDTPARGLPDARDAVIRAVRRARMGEHVREAALRRIDGLPGGASVLHGDLHPGNVIVTADGPRIIDWLTASAGPAAEDVARTLFLVRDSGLPPDASLPRRALIVALRRAFARTYLAAYRRVRPIDVAEIRAWRLPVLVARLDEQVWGERPRLERLIAGELMSSDVRPAARI